MFLVRSVSNIAHVCSAILYENGQKKNEINDNVQPFPQNTDEQQFFQMPCLFLLISLQLKPLTEIRTDARTNQSALAKFNELI